MSQQHLIPPFQLVKSESHFHTESTRALSPSINDQLSHIDFDPRNRAEIFGDEENKENKKVAAKKAQSQLKNIPGHIMLAIFKGCKYYFNKAKGLRAEEGKRSGQLNLRCISRVLTKESLELREKFDKFIEEYDTSNMTWSTIIHYIVGKRDPELIRVLKEIVGELFDDRNEGDLDNWLQKSKMHEEMREKIKNERAKLKKDFLNRLVKAENGQTP